MKRPQLSSTQLDDWCAAWLGARPTRIFFEAGQVSRVLGVTLDDRRQVVLKIRDRADRLAGCVQVQRYLWEAGYPSPEPFTDPVDLNGWQITAESYVPGGEALDPGPQRSRCYAEALAELMRRAPRPGDVATVAPAPPWVGWEGNRLALWPPVIEGRDLNYHPESAWLDDVARKIRGHLQSLSLPSVIGHGDWHGANVLWRGTSLHCVHDWDSVVCQPEAAIVGSAAVAFGETADAGAARVDETADFLRIYEQARRQPRLQCRHCRTIAVALH